MLALAPANSAVSDAHILGDYQPNPWPQNSAEAGQRCMQPQEPRHDVSRGVQGSGLNYYVSSNSINTCWKSTNAPVSGMKAQPGHVPTAPTHDWEDVCKSRLPPRMTHNPHWGFPFVTATASGRCLLLVGDAALVVVSERVYLCPVTTMFMANKCVPEEGKWCTPHARAHRKELRTSTDVRGPNKAPL
jgi:hypothetical protein